MKDRNVDADHKSAVQGPGLCHKFLDANYRVNETGSFTIQKTGKFQYIIKAKSLRIH
jgi:hypothetical protein